MMRIGPARAMDLRKISIGVIVGAGLLIQIGWVWPMHDRVAAGLNDFLAFYSGGKLAFSGRLYDQQRVAAIQFENTAHYGQNTYYIRFPWFAAMLAAISWMPYKAAYSIWILTNAAGLAYFLAAWRPGPLSRNAMLAAFFIPLAFALATAQDVPLLLGVMTGAVALARRERPGAAGLLLALCQAKIHIFAPLAILLAAGRRWRMLGAFLIGNCALMLASFAVAGRSWPVDFLRSISSEAVTPGAEGLPTLYALIHTVPHWYVWYAGAVIAALSAAVSLGRRAPIEIAIAAAPALSLPLLNHTYIYDCALLAPLCLLAVQGTSPVARTLGFCLLLPLPYLAAIVGPPYSWIVPLLTAGLLGVLAWSSGRAAMAFHGPPISQPQMEARESLIY